MPILSQQAILPGDAGATHGPRSHSGRPLVVDVDAVLLHNALLSEAVFSEIAHRSHAVFGILAASLRGPRALQRRLAQSSHFDPARLSYNTEVVAFLLQMLGEGRPVYLASDSHDSAFVT